MAIFTDPVGQLVITNPKTKDEWKWTGPKLPFLTGISINYEMGNHVPAFTVSFDIPYEDGLKMFEHPSPFTQGNVVEARIGYAGGSWTPWAGGFLHVGGDGLTLDANGVSGQISVQGVAESYGYTIDETVLREAGHDPVKILTALAGGMGLKPIISNGAKSALGEFKLAAGYRGKAIRKQTFDFACGLLSKSYWEAIKKICADWHLASWIGPEVGSDDPGRNLFVYTQSEVTKGYGIELASLRTYMLRGVIDESNLTYPAFSWSPEGSTFAAWLASEPDPAAHGVVAVAVDTGTGEIVEEPISPKKQQTAIYGVVTSDEPTDVEAKGMKDDEAKKDGSKGAHISPPMDEGGRSKLKAQGQHRQEQGSGAQQGVITALGLADERAGNICFLRGFGAIYDGSYLIKKLTHVWAPGSWEMTLTVLRHGSVHKTGKQEETSEGQMPQ